jgi:predicted dehydrogenase
LAGKKNLKIMVDHTFLYTSAVMMIKQLIEDEVLGDLYYFDSVRVNLGLFQHDVNVVWDLAPHDIAIMDYVIGEKPQAVVATGAEHFNRGLEDIAYLTFYYSHNVIAHINVNWLSPVKVRTTLIGGEKKMLVWNDLEPDEKIKIYDKGVQIRTMEGKYNLLVNYRSGDMWAPKVEQGEALRLMVDTFAHYVENGGSVVNDGVAGMHIVRMLEASDKSLSNKGEMVYLGIISLYLKMLGSGRMSNSRSSSIFTAARSVTTPKSAPSSRSRRTPSSAGTARFPATRSSARV